MSFGDRTIREDLGKTANPLGMDLVNSSQLLDGRYEIRGVLGSGGMAVVYRVLDRQTGVERALKLLSSEVSDQPVIRRRFENEARVMTQVRHDHIVEVQAVGSVDGVPYMVMELMECGSVGDRLKSGGPLDETEAIQVVRAVLRALRAAHEHGIVHRDVKPQNVLVDGKGIPRVTDFGIARADNDREGLTETGHVLGTLSYMAPEQNIDARQVDHRADLYAAGAMLYALLTARKPYALHQDELENSRLSDLPESLRSVVWKATRFHREKRYQSATEMLESLEACVDNLPAELAIEPRPVEPKPLPSSGESTMTWLPGKEVLEVQPTTPTKARRWPFVVALSVVFGLGALLLLVNSGPFRTPTEVELPDHSPIVSEGNEAETEAMPSQGDVPAAGTAAPSSTSERTETDAVGDAKDAPNPVVPPEVKKAKRPLKVRAIAEPADRPPPAAVASSGNWSAVFINAVPPAQLEIDGTKMGQTGWKGELEVGPHRVSLFREGADPVTRVIQVKEGTPVRFCWDYAAKAPCARR